MIQFASETDKKFFIFIVVHKIEIFYSPEAFLLPCSIILSNNQLQNHVFQEQEVQKQAIALTFQLIGIYRKCRTTLYKNTHK